jgi:hypothetical protein
LLGQEELAEKEFEMLVDRRAAAFGEDHVATLLARADLAWCLGMSGRLEEALQRDTVLLADRRRVLEHDHPDTLASQAQIADWLLRLGRAEEAADGYATLIADCTRVFGSVHALTRAATLGLATARSALDEPGMLK